MKSAALALCLAACAASAAELPKARVFIFVERSGAASESATVEAPFGGRAVFSAQADVVYTSKLEKLDDGATLRTERRLKQGFLAAVSPRSIDERGDALVEIELSDALARLSQNPDGTQTPSVEPLLARKAQVALTPFARPRMVAQGPGERVFMALDFGPGPRTMFAAQGGAAAGLFFSAQACLRRLALDAQDPDWIQRSQRGEGSLSCSARIQSPQNWLLSASKPSTPSESPKQTPSTP